GEKARGACLPCARHSYECEGSEWRAHCERRRGHGIHRFQEAAMHLVEVVPYLLEDVLKEQGARFSSTANWGVHVVKDGFLITGQNPQSSKKAARILLDALGEQGVRP